MRKLNLKEFLKNLKLNESTISMVLGAVVIVIVGVLVVNYFRGLDTGSTIPAVETENMAEEMPRTHVVQPGEDLWSIAVTYYDSGYNWTDIAEANDLASPGNITEGQELIIPERDETLADAAIEETVEEPTQQPTATPDPDAEEEAMTEDEEDSMDEEAMEESREDEDKELASDEDTDIMEESDTEEDSMDEEAITGDTYTVVRGDNLWNIAVRAYGDGYRWVEIAEANDLVNPNLIHAGNEFILPR